MKSLYGAISHATEKPCMPMPAVTVK